MEENILQFLVPVKTPKCVPRQEIMAYLPITSTLGQSTKHAASQKLVSDIVASKLDFLIEQSKGTATDRVMSQNAVTVELNFLQNEINVLKNNPDVVDIVPTKAALDLYDTSNLSDKDIIRVLVDETHDGSSTFYRWNLSQERWDYIGKVGDYYTKSEVNALLVGKLDKKTTTGKFVYTHNGETQGEMEVKSEITQSDNEIPTSSAVLSSISELAVPKSNTSGLHVYSQNGGLQGELAVDESSLGNDDYSTHIPTSGLVKRALADKQDKLDVEVPTHVDADINLTLENNKEFRYGVLYGAINISFPSNPELDFMCELDIQSLPSMSYPNNIKWSGDDIENGVFVPDSKALTPYHILFYTSGVSNNIWNAIVRKPSV